MSFSISTYDLNDKTVKKIAGDHYWVMTYDDILKKITSGPYEVFSANTETTKPFCVKETEEECKVFAYMLSLTGGTVYSGSTN